MFRRSRLLVRPNVGVTGRPQEAPPSNKDCANANTPASVTDPKPADAPNEPTQGDPIEQHGEAARASAIQRRKRFSVKPKVVPGRPSALPRTLKSLVRPVHPPVKSPAPVIDKAATSEANSTAPLQDVLSPKECELSRTDVVPPAEGSSEDVRLPVCQVKEIPPKAPVPPSIPDRETIEISEKAKTLVSKTDLTASSEPFTLTQLLNDKVDLIRLEKARKLKQLLKEHKVKSKRSKARVKEHMLTLDPSKMTMRDLIHYLPMVNPMLSTLEESQQENETVVPLSPEREVSPERAQEPEVQPQALSQEETPAAASAEEEREDEEEAAAEDEDAVMVPQVKVAEDGSLIIDEESLTVEVQRMKGPNTIQDRDPIFERGSTTTYSSFRKGTHTKPWSTEETDMFFLAVSMVGTDFTMICQLFPHRARTEIKNKFKKEERVNAWRIDKAFRERRKLDLEYFKKLLQKILEFQQSKRKLKSISGKIKTPQKRKRKTKGKKSSANLSDVEEETEGEMSYEEQEGEKENLCNDKTSDSEPKRQRKDKADLPPDLQVDKKKRKKKNVPDSEEAPPPEDQCEKTESPASTKKTEATSGKPAKALHPFDCKGRKAPKSKATVSDKEDATSEEAAENQIDKDFCSAQNSPKGMSDNDSSDQEISVPSSKPTRSGRMSKPVELLNYPAKEDKTSSGSNTPARQTSAPAKAKGKTAGKRGRSALQQSEKEAKKPKLITLRASQSEEDSDEEEGPDAPQYDDEHTAFVPASLCSPKAVVPEVQETMEELDFLTHMPDVLGMSENALCLDASCEQAHNERGTIEPCEHQLDLLVDVIDFLSEHAETSGDEDDNEAAQTLLAIGNLAKLSQPKEASMSDHTEIESCQYTEVNDTSTSPMQLEEHTQAASQPSTTEVNPAAVQPPTSHTSDTLYSPQERSTPPRKGRLSKVSPKPNLGSRTAKLRTQTVGAALETKLVELETATTSQQSSKLLQSTETLCEPSQTESSSTDKTVMPSALISNTNVSLEPCGLQEAEMSPKLTTAPETTMRFSLTKEESSSTIQQIQLDLSTTKETVEAVQEKTQVYGDIATTGQLSSLEHQEESTLPVSEQPNTKNETAVSTTNETPASQTSDTQVIKPSDESCSSQETTTTSQPATPSAIHPPMPRKGRLSKIKPKPNIGCVSRTSKLSSKSAVIVEEKMQIECEIAAIDNPQSAALSASDSGCCRESVTLNSQGTDSDPILETSRSQEQTESGSQSTLETHLEHLQEKCGTPFVQCEEKARDQVKPVIKSTTTIESGNMDSTQIDDCSKEEKSANTSLVQQSPLSSESSNLGTPQRRRWIPKVKPKLVLSPRTTKAKVEANEMSHTTDELVKSSSGAATSEQVLQDNTSTIPPPADVEQSSISSVSSNVDISRSTMATQQASSGPNTNTDIKLSSVSELNTRSTKKAQTKDISEDPTAVVQSDESSATIQTHLERIECTSFESGKTVHQLQYTTLKKTGICQESRASSTIHGAVELCSKLQHNEAPNVSSSAPGKVQDSVAQNTMECQNIFPTMPPSEIPSDPDEPFFILSLTEIPVCPSGDLVGSGSSLPVTEAQQRNPVEPAEPLAAGIDISLSNIHIPTPEKAALGSGLICVEEYLPSAPSVDISILAETPEKPSVRRLTLPEAQGNSSKADSLSTGSQTPVRGAVDTKTSSRRQNVSCKAVAEEANWQDHTKASAHAESCREMVEHMDSKSQEESDGSSVTKKITKKSAETRMNQPQHRKTKATCGPLWEQTEIQYFGSPTSKIKNLFTCLSEPSKSQQSDSTNMEEEPTNISDFRTNITEETLKEIPGDGACHDKTQRKPAATMATIGKQRKTNTSMKLPREQKKIPTEKQLTEVSVNEATSSFILQENLAAFSAPVRSIDSSQQDHKKANKKGNANRKNKGLNEAKHLKESTSSSGTGPGPTHESNPQSCLQSTSGPRVSRQSDSIESCSKKEEPTDVSQYFISDVFTEVESDDRVTGTSNNTARSDKSQTAETIRNKGQNIKVNASYDSSSGQRSSLNEEQPAEVSVTNEATSSSSSVKTPPTTSVTETTSGPSQTDAKTTRGKGSSNTKNKAICKSLKSQKKCKEASRFPEAVSPDSLKETQSRSSRRLRGGSEFPVFKDDSSGSNEEPTHVSQCLAGDAFTKAESGTCKVARKPIKDDVCTEKTQTSETRMKTREKRKTKASSGPLCSQRNPLTEEHPSETSIANKTQKTVKSAELNQPVTEKMKGKEQSNRNKKASSGAEARGSRPQTALKSPETLPMERIKESPLGKPQLPGLQSDPKGSSDDEPTNVSQYFLSDVFTEVDEEFKS